MSKIVSYANIPEIKDGIFFCDPAQEESPNQYHKVFQDIDWLMKLETERDRGNYINLTLLLGRRTLLAGLKHKETDIESGQFCLTYPSRFNLSSVTLRAETGDFYIGNLENYDCFCSEPIFYIGGDPLFGDLYVFTCKGEEGPAGFLLLGVIDGSLTSEEEFFAALLAGLDGTKIGKRLYDQKIKPKDPVSRFQAALEFAHADSYLEGCATPVGSPNHEN